MSLTNVRPYFRTRLDSLGFEELMDGFDFRNVPETIIDKTYHLTVGVLSSLSVTNTVNDISYPVLLRIYLKGFRDPATAIDDAILEGERVICNVTKVENANQQGVKGVEFVSFEPVAKDETNDNIVLLDMSFNARVILDRR